MKELMYFLLFAFSFILVWGTEDGITKYIGEKLMLISGMILTIKALLSVKVKKEK